MINLTHSQRCFHILKQSSNADFGMAFNSRVALLWIVTMSSNRFPLNAIFNFGNIQKSQGAWPETRSFSSRGITQSFQNFNVIFFVDRLTFWSKFVVHNTLTIEKNNQHWLAMTPTLTCFLTVCITPLSVLCPYFHPQRPSVSFQSSPYNSCRDRSKTWCKFVDLFFLSFSTVNKCDERKKHDRHKHTLRATQGVRPVTTAFREFVRDYWLRSYPAEANRALWREDINAGRILSGHTSYIH